MKHRLSALFLSLACMIALAGCKRSNDPVDPSLVTDKPSVTDKEVFNFGSSPEYDPDAPHGEKKVYGSIKIGELPVWEDTIGFMLKKSQLGYYYIEKPTEFYDACFDPTCNHNGEDCPAYNSEDFVDGDEPIGYPSFMVLDKYDNADSPVIYYAYKQSKEYTLTDGGAFERDNCYRIDRYDISSGKRVTLHTDIPWTITSLNTYGDYIYFTLIKEDQTMAFMRLHKSGGIPTPVLLPSNEVQSLKVLDITDDYIYYLFDEYCLYRCSTDLSTMEAQLWVSTLTGKEERPAILHQLQNGYLYYMSDFETVTVKSDSGKVYEYDKCNCYRLPMDDLNSEPQIVAEAICYGETNFAFTDNYFYYEPAVYRHISKDEYSGSQLETDFSGGDLCAVNLDTLEASTVVNDCGMVIYIEHTYGDNVIFYGTPISAEGEKLTDKWLIAYPDGTPYEAWLERNTLGKTWMNRS